MKKHRNKYYEFLVQKMKFYLNKHIIDNHILNPNFDINFSNSQKGFEIGVHLINNEIQQNEYFSTLCFPAGGYNIQRYHYRYKGSIK